KRSLFLGSCPNFHAKVHQLEDIKRFKKYGPVWGVYEGQDPQIHIADPELVRMIFVRDFDHFHDRRHMDFGSDVFNEILDYLPGKKWKTVRQMLTPMLTTAKLKLMSPIINSSAEEFAVDLRMECVNGRIKIDCRRHERMTTWLIDMFTRATLGVQMGDAKNPLNDFAVAFRTFMGEETVFDWMYSLSLTFPFLTKFSPTFDNGPTDLIEKTFRHVLKTRRDSGEKKNHDLVDILNDLIDRTATVEYKELKITENTIISQ
ncbi:Cytochrome P450 3A11, partial [Pseudolycoriella hygida]